MYLPYLLNNVTAKRYVKLAGSRALLLAQRSFEEWRRRSLSWLYSSRIGPSCIFIRANRCDGQNQRSDTGCRGGSRHQPCRRAMPRGPQPRPPSTQSIHTIMHSCIHYLLHMRRRSLMACSTLRKEISCPHISIYLGMIQQSTFSRLASRQSASCFSLINPDAIACTMAH